MHCRYFDTTQSAITLFSDTNSGWRAFRRATPLPSEICAQSDQFPSKNVDFEFPLITSQP